MCLYRADILIVKKENIALFLLAKMYEINFHHHKKSMFDEAGTVCLNMKRHSKESVLSWKLSKLYNRLHLFFWASEEISNQLLR